MGKAVAALVEQSVDLQLTGTWSRGDDLAAIASGADVIIDFSLPGATREVAQIAQQCEVPLVCGVTGQSGDELAALEDASAAVPVIHARNTSQGITLLGGIMSRFGALLGPEFDVRIEETHHVHKKDKPSGTAVQLRAALSEARDLTAGDIPVHSEREGEVIGDHSVIFESPTETLTISHSAKSRDLFAEGAIRAARWIVQDRAPGLYSMSDVLGLYD